MDSDIAVLKGLTEHALKRLERTCDGLTEIEANWKPIEEANNILWILNHLGRITNYSLPRIIKGNPKYIPEGWPEEYEKQGYSLEKALADIQTGKETVLEGLSNLESASLAEIIPLWGGPKRRDFGLFSYILEIAIHRGQIAALRGNIKRRRERDTSFLI